jgi:hypothetical protein
MKITKKTAILTLFTAVLLVSAPMAVTVFAQPSGPGTGMRGYGASHNAMGSFRQNIVPILMGHGFAVNPSDESQYHILDVTAMKIGNATQSRTRANLRFAGQPYGLNITSYTNTSLIGTIETVPLRGTNHTGFIPTQVGSISLSMSNYEGVMLSNGTLTMTSGNYTGAYNVLLTSPVIATGGGMHNANGMFGARKFGGRN